MRVLALDSSAKSASVAVMDGPVLLGEGFVNTQLTHSQTLMPMVQQVLMCAQIPLDSIDLFAVTVGPGSFTGVRIGTSCVQGMAMAQKKPCVGVSTLEAIAYNLTDFDGIICAVMDARRQQVYHACFESQGGILTRLTPDRALAIDALAEECRAYGKTVYLAGDGAVVCYESAAFQDVPDVRLPAEPYRYQRGYGTARAALESLKKRPAVDAGELVPVYLRPPQAERERKQRLEREAQL